MALGTQSFATPARVGTTVVFLACLLLYGLTAYGGIRSPDNEIVFRAAASFAERLRLDVGQQLADWDGFGVARARDGRDYPIFGPGESIALAPFVLAGRAALASGWSTAAPPPPSFYVADGLFIALYGAPMRNPAPHTLRLICSLYNVLVGALCAVVFLRLARRLCGSEGGALVATAFFAFASLLWPYAGTFFSEPLALLFVLLSTDGLVRLGSGDGRGFGSPAVVAGIAGVCLGVAVSTHLTAALYIPFLAALPTLSAGRRERPAALRKTGIYLAGLGVTLALLGMYNYGRFGDPFQTGRSVDPEAAAAFGYGSFVAPWPGLYGLILGPGKGLLLFSPAVLLGLLCWPAFHRKHRALSLVLAAAGLARLLFVAMRSDWHGGFCLGPRYLLLLVPFLLLPIAVTTGELLQKGNRRVVLLIGVVLALCAAQQAYFCVGEIFSFLHRVKFQAERAGLDIFTNDRIYLEWRWSPLFGLLKGHRGPFLLRGVPLSNTSLWLGLSALLGAPLLAGMWAMLRQARSGDALRGVPPS
jgi:hypothetical protein